MKQKGRRNAMTVKKHMGTGGRARAILLGFFVFAGFLFLGCSPGHAVKVEYTEGKAILLDYLTGADHLDEEWYAAAYDIGNIDEINDYCPRHPDDCMDETGQVPAMKLCFWHDPGRKTERCHRIEDAVTPGYTYSKTTSLKIVQLCDTGCVNGAGLVLDALDDGFTTGSIGALSCWVYDPKLHDFVNILPDAKFTEQDEYKIFANLGSGIEGVVVLALHLVDWQKESRYSRHRYLISIYKQSRTGLYREIGHYTTAGRYPSLDNVDEIDVIIPELERIKHFILSKEKSKRRN